MKRVFFATLTLVAIFVIGACSSATEDKSSAKVNPPAGTSNANSNAAVQNGSEVSPPVAADANAVNIASENAVETAANRLKGKMDALRSGSKEPIDNARAEADAMKGARQAPDNSTYTSYLTDAGYEVRAFSSHPQLLKVVKRIAPEAQTMKVYLRDGRVIERPANTIPTLATATADAILAASGVQRSATAPKQPAQGSAVTKKTEN